MSAYKQCDGDVSPATYGGSFFRVSLEGEEFELVQLQPVAEYIGEREAAELDGAFWLKSTVVDRLDMARLFSDEGWRSWVGMSIDDMPDPATASIKCLASWATHDVGYGLFDWEEEGNLSGGQVNARYELLDFQGLPLEGDLLEEDEVHEERKEERK